MNGAAGPSRYSMLIQWDAEDQVYVVTVPELPGCQTHGATYEEAARRGQEAIESWIASALADGAPVPAPRVVAAWAERRGSRAMAQAELAVSRRARGPHNARETLTHTPSRRRGAMPQK